MSASDLTTRAELDEFFLQLDSRWESCLKKKRERDRNCAEDFSVFQFISVDENTLSDIFAFLLDPRETHGQRDLFLKLFAKQIGWRADVNWEAARVVREARTYAIPSHRRRIDILVTAPGTTLAIENKIEAEEAKDQLRDYNAHIKDSRGDYCVVFITPDGRPPDRLRATQAVELQAAGRLRLLSHASNISSWIKECQRECKAASMKHFLCNLLGYINTHLNEK